MNIVWIDSVNDFGQSITITKDVGIAMIPKLPVKSFPEKISSSMKDQIDLVPAARKETISDRATSRLRALVLHREIVELFGSRLLPNMSSRDVNGSYEAQPKQHYD